MEEKVLALLSEILAEIQELKKENLELKDNIRKIKTESAYLFKLFYKVTSAEKLASKEERHKKALERLQAEFQQAGARRRISEAAKELVIPRLNEYNEEEILEEANWNRSGKNRLKSVESAYKVFSAENLKKICDRLDARRRNRQ